ATPTLRDETNPISTHRENGSNGHASIRHTGREKWLHPRWIFAFCSLCCFKRPREACRSRAVERPSEGAFAPNEPSKNALTVLRQWLAGWARSAPPGAHQRPRWGRARARPSMGPACSETTMDPLARESPPLHL